MRKVLVACDSFKDALPAAEVCAAVAEGLKAGGDSIEPVVFPLGDGGEGTVEVLAHHFEGSYQWVEVNGPLFRPVRACYFLTACKGKAFIEMAAASGLQLVGVSERNPSQTTTFGTGELIRHAVEAGAREVILCIGGSATNDGGMGMAQALGYEFFDRTGNQLTGIGGNLHKIAYVEEKGKLSGLDQVDFSVLCDVENFLSGPTGAAPVFAAQKGASAEMIVQLDRGLAHLGIMLKRHFGYEFDRVNGAGAAGGLGAGAMAFLGAKLRSGAPKVLEITNFSEQLRRCSLVVTGEGRIDGQTAYGKLIHGVCQAARQYDKPVVGLCGALTATPQEIESIGLIAAFPILRKPADLETAIAETRRNLMLTAFNVGRLINNH